MQYPNKSLVRILNPKIWEASEVKERSLLKPPLLTGALWLIFFEEGKVYIYNVCTCIVCMMYVLQFIPYMVCRLFFDASLRIGFFIQFQWPQKISYLIYYTQYVPNIFIYVTRNRSYRNAYVYWIKSVFCCFSNNDVEVNGRDNSNSLRNDHRSQRNNFPIR